MKASIKAAPILSIGMIVKNEGKVLRRCLESVKKIMSQLDCQLIITDTGSTDDTVKIAEEYADIVNTFEWCDDYSAARNAGLKLATGEWYAFIDGDEWFSDEGIRDVVAFFKSGEYKKFNSAFIMHRNYHDRDFYDYYDVQLLRFIKRTKDTCFVRTIHETLTCVEPTLSIKGYINHDGYIIEDAATLNTKRNKLNEAIERQLEDNFDDPSLLISYSSTVQNIDRKEQVLQRLLKYAQDNNNQIMYNNAYFKLIQFYIETARKATALTHAHSYIKDMSSRNFQISVDGYLALAQIFLQEKEYKLGVEYLDLYLQGVKSHAKNPNHSAAIEMHTIGKKSYEQMLIQAAALLIAHDPKLSVKYYKMFDYDGSILYLEMYKHILAYYKETPEEIVLFAVIDTLHTIKSAQKRTELQQLLSEFLFITINNDHIYSSLTSYPKDNLLVSAFVWLHTAKTTGKALPTVRSVEQLANNDAIAPYIATLMCMQVNIAPEVLHILNREQIISAAESLQDLDTDFLCELAMKNINYAQKAKDIKELLFYITLLGHVFDILPKDNISVKILVATTAIDCTAAYAKMYYSPDLIQHDIELLPPPHRFALRVNSTNKSNPTEYVKALRNAINSSPSMKAMAQLLLSAFEQELEGGKLQPKTEFEILAENVKENAKTFIAKGNVQEAFAVLSQLKSLVPNDGEIDNLLKMCK